MLISTRPKERSKQTKQTPNHNNIHLSKDNHLFSFPVYGMSLLQVTDQAFLPQVILSYLSIRTPPPSGPGQSGCINMYIKRHIIQLLGGHLTTEQEVLGGTFLGDQAQAVPRCHLCFFFLTPLLSLALKYAYMCAPTCFFHLSNKSYHYLQLYVPELRMRF